ncbi:MAG: transposase [Chloroflexales bacterium]|nr:transposase [Chloroflexales bacterium]
MLALEDLTHIRQRATVRRSQRARRHNWSFGQLRAFISYKAQRAGIPAVLVDPRNTSRRCPACGHTDKANRPNQAIFRCVACGHTSPADVNAAINIERAAVRRSMASESRLQAQAHVLAPWVSDKSLSECKIAQR